MQKKSCTSHSYLLFFVHNVAQVSRPDSGNTTSLWNHLLKCNKKQWDTLKGVGSGKFKGGDKEGGPSAKKFKQQQIVLEETKLLRNITTTRASDKVTSWCTLQAVVMCPAQTIFDLIAKTFVDNNLSIRLLNNHAFRKMCLAMGVPHLPLILPKFHHFQVTSFLSV